MMTLTMSISLVRQTAIDYLHDIICGKFAMSLGIRAVTVEVINRTHPHALFEVSSAIHS